MSRGALSLLLAALLAPLVPAAALAECCAERMPCCPEGMGAPEAGSPEVAAVSAPVPACCQTVLPAEPSVPADRKGTPAARAPLGVLSSSSQRPEVALPSAGRTPTHEPAPAEDPPTESRSARAPPIG